MEGKGCELIIYDHDWGYPWWGGWTVYWIVTMVTSDIGMPLTYLVELRYKSFSGKFRNETM